MAPIQQFVSTAASNSRSTSDLTTGSTRDFVNSVHKVKENYSSNSSSSISSSSHSDAAHSSMTGSRPGDATQQETLLPISSRGHFFSDAFFEDARQHFESAVRKVLERRGHSRSSVHDDLTSYRMLRQADLSESTQAATVTENATCHQVSTGCTLGTPCLLLVTAADKDIKTERSAANPVVYCLCGVLLRQPLLRLT